MEKARKNILFITTFPPNNITAGQSNTNTVIDDLINKGYILDLITFTFVDHKIDRPERFNYIKIIKKERIYKYIYSLLLIFFFPLYTTRVSLRIIFFLLKKQTKYDAVYLDYSQVFIYSWFVGRKMKTLLMTHDIILQSFARKSRKKWYKKIMMRNIFFSERFFFRRASIIIVLSFKDSLIVKKLYHLNATAILPKKRFKVSINHNSSVCLKQFVFLGAWNRAENLQGLKWFLENVYPSLETDLRFIIIGGGLSANFINKLPPSFSALGFVDDFRIYLEKSSALISPLFLGAGIKFKVLDALSNGCRVIGTDIAFEGIDIRSPNILFKANTREKFIESILYCSQQYFNSKLIKKEFREYIDTYRTITDIV